MREKRALEGYKKIWQNSGEGKTYWFKPTVYTVQTLGSNVADHVAFN